METPEDKNKDVENPQETPEQEPGNDFDSEQLDENQAEETPPESAGKVMVMPAARQQPRRSWFQRILYALFSPETRAGRFFRPFLRAVALFVGAFALGMLITYLVIFQPVTTQLSATQAQLATAQSQLATNQTALTTAKTNVDQLSTQVATVNQQADSAQTRVHLLLLTTDVKNAQLALLNKDGPGAQKALDSAKQELSKIQPALQKLNASVAEGIQLRLNLASTELVSDPKTAQSDLDILNTNLMLLDQLLAKQFD